MQNDDVCDPFHLTIPIQKKPVAAATEKRKIHIFNGNQKCMNINTFHNKVCFQQLAYPKCVMEQNISKIKSSTLRLAYSQQFFRNKILNLIETGVN